MNLNQETKIKNVWYFRNKQPIIEAKRKGQSQNFYGTLNMKTGKCAAMTADKQNGKTTVKFLKKLTNIYKNKKIFLVWDNASWHKNKEIRGFLRTKQGKRFDLFNFPPYTPEFNPQEHVWKNLRQHITHNRMEKDFSVIVNDCLKYLNRNNFSSIKFEKLFSWF